MSGGIVRCIAVSQTTEPHAKPKPAKAAAGASAKTDAWNASSTLWMHVGRKIVLTTTSGRLTRSLSPATLPSSAPTPSPVTTAPHVPAPPIECFAMYGPSTKNGAYVNTK